MSSLQVASISTTNLTIQGIISANSYVSSTDVRSNTFTGNSATISTITAGNVTGNVIGNLTGNVTGNVTSDLVNTNTLTAQVISGSTLSVLNSISVNNRVVISNTGLADLPSPGNTSNVLTSNGTAWISRSLPGSGFSTMNVFTSSGTFTIPAGINVVKVTVVGGGGGGSGGSSTIPGRGGGAGAAGISFLRNLTSGNTILVTVGAGGTGSDGNSNAPGNTGGNSIVQSGTQIITTITAFGGNGGEYGGNPGGGNTASGADLNIKGGGGGATGASTQGSGSGGNSIFGAGGRARTNGVADNGGNYGGGGGGAPANGVAEKGGNGGAGVVIFEY